MGDGVFGAACERASVGMEIAAVAALEPHRPAVIWGESVVSFAELNQQVNQVARLIRSVNIGEGDSIALVCSNRSEFVVVRFACHRLGVRLTPVNCHLSTPEAAYIVDNCDARAVFLDTSVCAELGAMLTGNSKLVLKIAIGEPIADFKEWTHTLSKFEIKDISTPALGATMLYTSGTTGQPKGVLRKQPDPQKAADMQALLTAVFQFQPETGSDLALVTGPLYHAGPFNLCMTTPLCAGIGIVLMSKFDALKTLQLIAVHRISHTFLVPTMMTRLLRLTGQQRREVDVSSLRFIIHGAAPCPVNTKAAMLEWFGPIIWEMFAGTEGPGTLVSPQEWLARPGTVGRPGPGQLKIVDEQGAELSPGESGQVFLVNPPESAFEYYNDAQKTARAQRDGYFTAGDIGYIDEDGYLFLTGRSAEVIICGGVNIYPQEIDDVLAQHPSVDDVACVGIPNEEWGEEIKAIVVLTGALPGSRGLEKELIGFCMDKMAAQKVPRSVDFVDKLARSETGKLMRRNLRAPYWRNSGRTL